MMEWRSVHHGESKPRSPAPPFSAVFRTNSCTDVHESCLMMFRVLVKHKLGATFPPNFYPDFWMCACFFFHLELALWTINNLFIHFSQLVSLKCCADDVKWSQSLCSSDPWFHRIRLLQLHPPASRVQLSILMFGPLSFFLHQFLIESKLMQNECLNKHQQKPSLGKYSRRGLRQQPSTRGRTTCSIQCSCSTIASSLANVGSVLPVPA